MTENISTRPATCLSAVPFERLLGRRGSAPDSPFLLPDDGGGQDRPLDGGQSTARQTNTLAQRVARGEAQSGTDDAQQASEEPEAPSPRENTTASARQVATRQAGRDARRAGDAGASPPKPPGGEKPSHTQRAPGSAGVEQRSMEASEKPQAAVNQQQTSAPTKQGTEGADLTSAMLRLFLRKQLPSASNGQKAAAPVKTEVLARAHALVDARHPRRRKDDDRREQRQETAAHTARQELAAPDRQATQVRESAASPQLAELPSVILNHMERLRQAGQNSLRVALKLGDGSPLDLRLQWRGGRLMARFSGASPAMRRELENAWGQLVRSAGEQGLQLEPPQFDEFNFNAA